MTGRLRDRGLELSMVHVQDRATKVCADDKHWQWMLLRDDGSGHGATPVPGTLARVALQPRWSIGHLGTAHVDIGGVISGQNKRLTWTCVVVVLNLMYSAARCVRLC